MKIIKNTSYFIILILVNSFQTASAELVLTDNYYGLQLGAIDLDNDNASKLGSYSSVKFILGKRIDDQYSYEGHVSVGTGFSKDDGVIAYGGYLKVNYPDDENDTIYYGLVGLGGVLQYSYDLGDNSVIDFSYGAGIELFAVKTFSVTMEWVQVVNTTLDGNDYNVSTLGLGYTYYFSNENSKFTKNRRSIRSIRPNYR